MIYQVGKKQCSNSGRKRNDIDSLESDFIVQPPSPLEFPGPLPPPPGIFNSLHGGGVDISWNHTILENVQALKLWTRIRKHWYLCLDVLGITKQKDKVCKKSFEAMNEMFPWIQLDISCLNKGSHCCFVFFVLEIAIFTCSTISLKALTEGAF